LNLYAFIPYEDGLETTSLAMANPYTQKSTGIVARATLESTLPKETAPEVRPKIENIKPLTPANALLASPSKDHPPLFLPHRPTMT
jgi:hypothetical protein